ncbi:hypothetical protein H0H81_010800 [Sphagnurus paluster]|uniref:NYN domain-containing protein n=1 Tax=Sphagnurus paluster TaxID=117069 RepID=A0A9P7K746_9AGAR|nr:hypothetical protein H0H81_010800 [Sphagnurus paluster]
MSQRVAIFWDFETCQLPPGLTGFEAADNIRRVANSYGSVTLFNLYTESADEHAASSLLPDIQSQLELCGVPMIHCNKTDSNLPTKLATDMVIFALDTSPPATLVLISGNPTFTYPVSLLRRRGYHVVLALPFALKNEGLGMQASVVFNWEIDILDAQGRVQAPGDHANLDVGNLLRKQALNSGSSSSSKTFSRKNNHENSSTTSPHPSDVASTWRRTSNVFQSPKPPGLTLDTDAPGNDVKHGSRTARRHPPSPLVDKTHNPNLPSPLRSSSPLPRHSPLPELANFRSYKNFRKDWGDKTSEYGSGLPPIQTSLPDFAASSSTTTLSANHTNFPVASHSPNGNMGNDFSRHVIVESPLMGPRTSYTATRSILSATGGSPRSPLRTEIHSSEVTSSSPRPSVAQSSPGSSPLRDRLALKGPPRNTFSLLVETLLALRLEDNPQPLRSLVGARLPKSAYLHAGAADFGQYVALAEREEIVQLGGSGGKSWIRLHPNYNFAGHQ